MLVLLLGLGCSVDQVNAQPDFNHPWSPATPLPQFITHVFVEPADVIAISRYRSGAGHSFSDNYEPSDRSLKNYFEPRAVLLGTRTALAVTAPATGTLVSVTPEGHILANGERRGFQLSLIPDGYPGFEIRLFHVNLAAGLGAGSHVNAGDALGFADLREAVDFDWAVGAAWNAVPLFADTPGQVLRAPGYRLLSPFDLMTDGAFATYAAYGVADRSDLVVPFAYRATHPGTFAGQDSSHFDPVEFFTLDHGPLPPTDNASVVVNQPFTYTLTMLGAAAGYTATGMPVGLVFDGVTGVLAGAPLISGTFQVVFGTTTGNTTATLHLTVREEPVAPGRLYALSVRSFAGAGDNTLIMGVVLAGSGPKPLVVRGVGPNLAQFGVSGFLADPRLRVFNASGTLLQDNDDWGGGVALTNAVAAVGLAPLPSGSNTKDP